MKENLDPILWYGGIELLAERYHTIQTHPTLWLDKLGFAKIHKVTTDIAEAVEDVELILLFVHAYRHKSIAELLAPHLRDEQTIVISNGMAGELVFAKTMKDKGIEKNVLLAGTGSSIYGARRGLEYGIGENQVITPQTVLVGPADPRAKTNIVSAFPSRDTNKVIEKLSPIWRCVPGTNVLQVDLANSNLINHAPLCILSATWIDASMGKFRMHLQARDSPICRRVCETVRNERDAIYKKMGWTDPSREVSGNPTKEPSGINLHLGPVDLMHRFLNEDIQIGDRLLSSLGDMIEVPTPTIDSLIHLASIINGIDYFETGRTADKIGIGKMDAADVNRFLADGY